MLGGVFLSLLTDWQGSVAGVISLSGFKEVTLPTRTGGREEEERRGGDGEEVCRRSGIPYARALYKEGGVSRIDLRLLILFQMTTWWFSEP